MNAPLSSKIVKNEVPSAMDADNLQRICDALAIRTIEDASAQFASSKLDRNEFIAICSHLTASASYAKSNGKRKAAPSYQTKSQLLAALPKEIELVIAGKSCKSTSRKFSTGAVGYNLTTKVEIGGELCQLNANITVCGSKELAE